MAGGPFALASPAAVIALNQKRVTHEKLPLIQISNFDKSISYFIDSQTSLSKKKKLVYSCPELRTKL